MVFLISHRHRGRGVLAILRSLLGRRRQCPHNSTRQETTVQDTNINKKDDIDNKDNEKDLIVNQPATLAGTISRISTSPTTTHSYPLCHTETQSIYSEKDQEEESFYYLRSLITISYLTPNPENTPTNQTLHVPPLRRRRASSRISLRLDIPGLSFAPKACKSKPSPRYTTLPPAYTPKPISIRPEVRF
ncbi:hypothetical protein N7507_004828 [Penicillium longicatenatum]|nr:hypothetical protein N7507_004828 [Penicillium longicatenatum]